MKEIVPAPPPIVRNQFETIRELFNRHVVPSYARFDLALARGSGSYVWDVNGRRYLDLGGGIAVCSLGHAHPEIARILFEQSQKLVHVSNLYYHEAQGCLAREIAGHIAPGKVFFCNSGAEANEGLFKLARKFGHEEGRFEILTAVNSFHGRTLAGIAATGQEKVKKGFEPMVTGFRHVPFNDLQAMRDAISPATVAILIEGIQGEGGIFLATRSTAWAPRPLRPEKAVTAYRWRAVRAFSNRLLPKFPADSGEHGRADGFFRRIAMAKSLAEVFRWGLWVRDKTQMCSGQAHTAQHLVALARMRRGAKDSRDYRTRWTRRQREEHGRVLEGGLQRMVDNYPRLLKACTASVHDRP
jgi:acetylornithine aminotransferase/acetylornithine/N-succinyldiaminopimelate aminotransferase